MVTLLRVFLEAGFKSKAGDIGQAIRLVRKSSSIGDESELDQKMSKADEDQFVELMKSQAGQIVMDTSNFVELFNRLLQLLATILTKTSLTIEDKLIIENALSIVVGILLYKNEIFAEFKKFTS